MKRLGERKERQKTWKDKLGITFSTADRGTETVKKQCEEKKNRSFLFADETDTNLSCPEATLMVIVIIKLPLNSFST